MDLHSQKIALIGYGISNQAVLHFLLARGIKPFISSNQESFESEALTSFQEHSLAYECGAHRLKNLLDMDLFVVSPGVNLNSSPFTELIKKGKEFIGDIELFYRYFPDKKYICITGSNGKTTTVELLYFMLKENLDVELCGNVGEAIFEFADSKKNTFILELSSFQIETLHKFKSDMLVITNLQPDHIDRYRDEEAYYQAKLRILPTLKNNCLLIFNKDCSNSSFFLKKEILAPAMRLCPVYLEDLCGAQNSISREYFASVSIGKDRLRLCKENFADVVLQLKDFQLQGLHNKYNLACCFAAANFLLPGFNNYLQERMKHFKALTHRLEWLMSIEGVNFINDSKATSMSASSSGINSLTEPLLILTGGQYKGDPMDSWLDILKEKSRKVFVFGAARELFFQAMTTRKIDVTSCEDLEDACSQAYQASKSGDTIVLSPACASFDMFKNYRERGRKFKEIVKNMAFRDKAKLREV
ncbi:UDP-N-acetylmuramoyl-L-alanine--D-glutamate ligase [Candidatus Riflebacteria bacterium]